MRPVGGSRLNDVVINVIDAVLTIVFWLPARFLGYKKCTKCTIRVRWFQFMLFVTRPVSRIPRVRSARIDWTIRVERPSQDSLRAVQLEELRSWQSM